MAFKISIPEPCHERWREMTPTQKGGFCAKCEKEVIDFTAYSNYELARKLGRGEKLCGRFRASQLDTTLPTLERHRWRERMAALGFTALLVGSCSPEPLQDPQIIISSAETREEPHAMEVEMPVMADSIPVELFVEIEEDILLGEVVIISE